MALTASPTHRMAEQSFTMFLQQDDKEMTRYSDHHSHGVAYTSASMDMGIPADTYSAYAGSLATTMGSLEQTMYSSEHGMPSYILNTRTSPSTYHDDGDMRLSSSGLSTASAPSAPSSVVGSPQSHTGHLGVPEWATMQPGIVGDYMTGGDYPTFSSSNVDDMSTFDFTQAKTFVGEFFFPFSFAICYSVWLACFAQRLIYSISFSLLILPSLGMHHCAAAAHRQSYIRRHGCILNGGAEAASGSVSVDAAAQDSQVGLACIAEPQDPLAPTCSAGHLHSQPASSLHSLPVERFCVSPYGRPTVLDGPATHTYAR